MLFDMAYYYTIVITMPCLGHALSGTSQDERPSRDLIGPFVGLFFLKSVLEVFYLLELSTTN